jgi:hypothetical protein
MIKRHSTTQNKELRTREHLTEKEVEDLIKVRR